VLYGCFTVSVRVVSHKKEELEMIDKSLDAYSVEIGGSLVNFLFSIYTYGIDLKLLLLAS
jgi:hypothetical protein